VQPDAVPTASLTINCGGAGAQGLYADLPRDAQCDRITVDTARRAVRFSAVVLAGGEVPLDGELTYPDFAIDASSTASSASLSACPVPEAEGVQLNPPSADAACLSGEYRGVSDTNRTCSVSIINDSGNSTVRVDIDGFTATYERLGSRDYFTQTVDGVLQRSWEYRFTPQALGPIDPAVATQSVTVGVTNVPQRFGSTGVVHAASFLITHDTAPAGVAGPYDVKFCVAPLR
jgi:hypothetical protein